MVFVCFRIVNAKGTRATKKVNESEEPSTECRWKVECFHFNGSTVHGFEAIFENSLIFLLFLASDTRVRPKNKVRGQTRGLMLEMKRKLSRDGKMDVDIHPTRLVAVGPGRNDFITDLSIIVRKNARFNVNKWSSVPQSTKDTIVEKVLVCYWHSR